MPNLLYQLRVKIIYCSPAGPVKDRCTHYHSIFVIMFLLYCQLFNLVSMQRCYIFTNIHMYEDSKVFILKGFSLEVPLLRKMLSSELLGVLMRLS